MPFNNPFPGNSSAFGPQAAGGNPTPFDAYSAQNSQQSTNMLMQWAALTDPRAMAAARMAGRTFTQGRPGFNNMSVDDFLKNTTEGRMIRSQAANGASLGVFGGGSVGQMAFGAQQMAGSSGFRMDIAGRPAGQQFYGSGYTTNMVSQQMISRVRDSFINPVTGLSEANAKGMNQTDMGNMMQSLASRGMFQGMNIGTLHQINPGDTNQRDKVAKMLQDQNLTADAEQVSKMDMGKGGSQFVLNKDTFNKVKRTMENTAAMLSDFRDIFGKDMPVGELINQAEKLTGMSFGTAGTPEAARAKLTDLKTKGQTFGMNVQQMVELDQNLQYGVSSLMATKFGGKPSDYASVAAKMTGNMMESGIVNTAERKAALVSSRESGKFVQDISTDDIMALQGQGMVNILGENGTAIEAMFAAEKFGNFADVKSQIHSLIGEMGSASTPKQQAAINKKLKDIMVSKGMDPGKLIEAHGGNPMELMKQLGHGSNNMLVDMASSNDQSRMLNSFTAVGESTGFFTRNKGSGITAVLMNDLMGSLGVESMDKLIEMTGNGASREDLLKFFKEKEGYLAPGKTAEDMADTISERMSGNPNFSSQLGEYTNLVRNDRTMANQTSREASKNSKRMQRSRFYMGRAFGSDAIYGGSAMDAAWRGITGDGEVTDSAILDYMRSQTPGALSEYTMNNDGSGLSINEKQANDLDAQLGGALSSALGASGAELAKVLGTDRGAEALQNALTSTSRTWGYSEKNGKKSITIAGEKEAKAAGGTMTVMNRALTAMRLSGEVTDQASEDAARKKLKDLARNGSDGLQARLEEARQNNVFTSGNAEGIDALVNKATSWGSSSEQYKAIKSQYADDPDSVIKGLDSRIKHYKEEAESRWTEGDRNEAKQQAQRLQGMKQDLQGGDKNFLGVVTMKMGDEFRMNLFEE
jgi:hypothetical protein